MKREFHVRFCEGLGGKFPRATRPVIVCANEQDALRIMDVLPKRFGRFGLTLHPEKTRLVKFRRPRRPPGDQGDDGPRLGSFDFLGFTHFWARTRKGKWAVRRKTSKERFNRAVLKIAMWCRRNRHLPVREQHRMLNLKLRGHDAYYGITWNSYALARLRYVVRHVWRKWLGRRGGRRSMTWERFLRLEERYPLAPATTVHSVLRHVAKP
jgi:RNA-directed DNA polymerase